MELSEQWSKFAHILPRGTFLQFCNKLAGAEKKLLMQLYIKGSLKAQRKLVIGAIKNTFKCYFNIKTVQKVSKTPSANAPSLKLWHIFSNPLRGSVILEKMEPFQLMQKTNKKEGLAMKSARK